MSIHSRANISFFSRSAILIVLGFFIFSVNSAMAASCIDPDSLVGTFADGTKGIRARGSRTWNIPMSDAAVATGRLGGGDVSGDVTDYAYLNFTFDKVSGNVTYAVDSNHNGGDSGTVNINNVTVPVTDGLYSYWDFTMSYNTATQTLTLSFISSIYFSHYFIYADKYASGDACAFADGTKGTRAAGSRTWNIPMSDAAVATGRLGGGDIVGDLTDYAYLNFTFDKASGNVTYAVDSNHNGGDSGTVNINDTAVTATDGLTGRFGFNMSYNTATQALNVSFISSYYPVNYFIFANKFSGGIVSSFADGTKGTRARGSKAWNIPMAGVDTVTGRLGGGDVSGDLTDYAYLYFTFDKASGNVTYAVDSNHNGGDSGTVNINDTTAAITDGLYSYWDFTMSYDTATQTLKPSFISSVYFASYFIFANCYGGICSASSFDYSLFNSGNTTVIQGNSGTNTVIANLNAGSSQSVSFSVSGEPAGVSVSLSRPACNPSCSTDIAFSAGASVPTGNYPITVSGSPLNKTTQFNLIVSAGPNHSLNLSASNLSVIQGESGNNNVTAALLSGSTQPISFSLPGFSVPGASYSFSVPTCSPTCSTVLTVNPTLSTPPGTYPITVMASPSGVTANFNLTVLARPPECNFYAQPDQITIIENSTLYWDCLYTDTVSISQGIGPVTPPTSGSVVVAPPDTTTYVLTATGPGGTRLFTTTVEVFKPALQEVVPR